MDPWVWAPRYERRWDAGYEEDEEGEGGHGMCFGIMRSLDGDFDLALAFKRIGRGTKKKGFDFSLSDSSYYTY